MVAPGTETIPLTPDAITAYLDQNIRVWQRVRDFGPLENRPMASYYAEAYQSIRLALIGAWMPSSAPVTRPPSIAWPVTHTDPTP